MKSRHDTFYRKQDRHGNSIACLRFELEAANIELRDRVDSAIRKAMAGPDPEPDQKNGAIGFHNPGSEDQ